jgi:hypothetical protein
VANEIGLVVITLGTDHGVKQGDEYEIFREGTIVGKLRIDRTDAKWSAGKVLDKQADPRVGDGVFARKVVTVEAVPATALVTGVSRSSADELRSLRKELDDVRSQVQSLTDRVLPSWKDAGVTVEEASEALCSQLQISRGLLVRRVKEGSPAARILKANDVIPDRTEAQLVDLLRTGGVLPVPAAGQAGDVPGGPDALVDDLEAVVGGSEARDAGSRRGGRGSIGWRSP